MEVELGSSRDVVLETSIHVGQINGSYSHKSCGSVKAKIVRKNHEFSRTTHYEKTAFEELENCWKTHGEKKERCWENSILTD